MIIPEEMFIRIAICALGFSGFLVARHIWKHKKENQAPLVCPIKFDCNAVVHSDYSKFLGVPVEIFGMIYYALLTIAYGCFIFLPGALPNALVGFMVIASMGAFLFSLYLICIQLFVLKKGCSWCFVSAFICILILILTTLAYDFSSLAGMFLK